MKNTIFIWFLTMSCGAIYAQSNWSDDFSNGNFLQQPEWFGDTGQFVVNSNGELQILDSVAGEAALYTYSAATDSATWTFRVRLEFTPSSVNYASVFLMTNTPDFWGECEGYFVRIGGGTQRTVGLMRRNGTSNTNLIESMPQFLSNPVNELLVRVHRSTSGQWTLMCDTSGSGGQWVNIGTVVDNTFTTGFFFGVACKYTVTRADKILFDDFVIRARDKGDSIPLRWTSIQVTSPNTLRLRFDKPPSVNSISDPVNYSFSKSVSVHSIHYNIGDPLYAEVILNDTLPLNTMMSLTLMDIFGVTGIEMPPTTLDFVRYEPDVRDIVINELMVNPTPAVHSLPEREYIELHNRTDFPIDIADWQLQVNSAVRHLPHYTIPPRGYVVLVREADVVDFPPAIPVLGINISSTALTNSSGDVLLFSPDNTLIHRVSYTVDWYEDNQKSGGGWSLEQIDQEKPCDGRMNWRASVSSNGGTPGTQNSVDGQISLVDSLHIYKVIIAAENQLKVVFNHGVFADDIESEDIYKVEGQIALVYVEHPLSETLIFTFDRPFSPSESYVLRLPFILEDCFGRRLTDTLLAFSMPVMPERGDIIINEVLHAPFSEGVSFIELKNISGKYLDLKGLRVGNYDEQARMLTNDRVAVEERQVFPPDGLLVFTRNPEQVWSLYPTHEKSVFHTTSLPSLPNGSGSCAIANASFQVLDSMLYDGDMHSAFLRDFRGVSLERLDATLPSMERSTWISAAESVGWATPGVKNSQTLPIVNFTGKLTLAPEVFRPNNSGEDDVLQVMYDLPKNGCIGSLYVYDPSGQKIVTVAEHRLLENRGRLIWDGKDQKGRRVRGGLYLIVMELTEPEGARTVLKDACAVVY